MDFLTPYYEKVNASRRRQLDLLLKQWWGFLDDMGLPQPLEALRTDPSAWESITPPLVLHYRQRLLNEGYADSTINRHLLLLRVVLKYAQQAGAVFPPQAVEQIVQIRGFGGRRGLPIPYPRRDQGAEDAEDSEDTEVVQARDFVLSVTQVHHLKHTHPDTLRGHRDALLLCLLLDQGLREISIAKLRIQDIDLKQGTLQLHYLKADTPPTLSLSNDTSRALRRYLAEPTLPQHGPLFYIFKRDGTRGKTPLFPRDISKRVNVLGNQLLGISWLTPQRCHDYWLQSHNPFNRRLNT